MTKSLLKRLTNCVDIIYYNNQFMYRMSVFRYANKVCIVSCVIY